MGGVYGDFVELFPELMETFSVWLKEDKSDIRHIRAMYIPTKGGGIKRRKYTSGNTALDVQETDNLYVASFYSNKAAVGDYIQKEGDEYILRLTGTVPYDRAAGYKVFTVERVTGATPDKDKELEVKEGYFA